MINNKYILKNKIGEGSFGSIYKAENYRTRELVAIKIEPIKTELKLLKNESKIYQYLLGTPGIPQVKWYGKDENNYYMVIPLLGKSLEQTLVEKQVFSLRLVLQIGIQLLQLLKAIHEKGLVHRDIKPDNFLIGIDSKQLFLIDFGLCKAYIQDDKHIDMKRTSNLIGSLTYASINAHHYMELSRRDDLESLAYMLIYFSLGFLPWRESKECDIVTQKIDIMFHVNIPNILIDFISYVRKLEFKEKPKYELFINKFTSEIEARYN